MIEYDITSGVPLRLQQNEHKMTVIQFTGFERQEEDTELYLVPDKGSNMLPITDEYQMDVTIDLTKTKGLVKCNIYEIKEEVVDDETVRTYIGPSPQFDVVIAPSAILYPEEASAERNTPFWVQMHDEYVLIKTKLENGELKGDKGDTGDVGPQGETGSPGPQGEPGNDGYTPVRGTDYWTESDKVEIVDDVFADMTASVDTNGDLTLKRIGG